MNPEEVACFREARSWQFIIKRKKLSTVWAKQNTNMGQVQRPIFHWQRPDCSLTHWDEPHWGRILVCLICTVSQAQCLGQNKPSINDLKPGTADRNFSTLCILPPRFPLWFYVPNNRLLIDNAMHMGPSEYLLSDCQNESLCRSAWLWPYSHCTSRRGKWPCRMLNYQRQESLVLASAR